MIDLENSINEKNKTEITLNDIAEVVRIIPTETNDSTLLSYINIAGITKKHIIVYDKNTVYYINKEDGKIQNKLECQGRGAGEYNQIFNVTVCEQDSIIYLYDPEVSKLNTYKFNGDYVNTIVNDSIGDLKIVNNNQFLTCFSPYTKTKYCLGIYDKSWDLIRECLPRKETPKLAMYYFSSISQFNNEYYFRAAHSDTIYHITSEYDRPYIIISKGPYNMPIDILTDLEKMNKESYKYIDQDCCLLASKYLFVSSYYNRTIYYDIWNIETSSLIYRSKYNRTGGINGIKLTVNDKQIKIWPLYVSNDHLYCTLEAEDALNLIPSLPIDTNPIILELKLKR